VNLLLDTHIWIWSHNETSRLGLKAREAIGDSANRLWLSSASVWEFMLLVERGRLALRGKMSATDWLEAAMSRAPMIDAPLTRDVAVRSRSVGLVHEDPVDRFLAATADVYDLTLLTADEALLQGKGYRTLANR
jgi:PIN domain nuclease of toxin-antitoxin system